MSEPISYQFEPFALNSVDSHPALLFVGEQARSLEDPKVPRGGLPRVVKDGRDLPRCHGAAVEVDRQQDAPSGGMGQRGKHRFVGIHAQFRVSRHHSLILSHIAKYQVKIYFA